MRPVSIPLLGLLAVVAAGAGALLCAVVVGTGHGPVLVTPYLGAVLGAIAALVLWAGLAVRRMRARKRTWMTPILAMRTALFARTCTLVGSAGSGLLAGIAVVSAVQLRATASAAAALDAGLACLGAVLLTVVAVVVERWCVIDSGGDGEDGPDSRGGRAPGTPA